jgi:sugar lactone lactonase YvrE
MLIQDFSTGQNFFVKTRFIWLLFLAASILHCRSEVDWPQLQFSLTASNLASPVHMTHSGDGSGKLFIVEQQGTVRILDATNLLTEPFLDIRSNVLTSAERGLLSIAFSPNYASNRNFYAFYTRKPDGAVRISRFSLLPDQERGDTNSEQALLTIPHPNNVHNGGQMAFGSDGYLYIGIGDGGYANVSTNPAQRLDQLLGKVLRIDSENGSPYVIPPTNPFLTNATARPEIWAYGLRNPWRFSFDRQTGDLYIADVGQINREEVNFQPANSLGGQNYGWPKYEGTTNFSSNFPNLNSNNLVFPAFEYSNPFQSCIIGGYVCRQTNSSRMPGIYLFADFMVNKVFGAKMDQGQWKMAELGGSLGRISAFAESETGQLFVTDYTGGKIYALQDSLQTFKPTVFPVGGIIFSNLVTVSCLTSNASIHFRNDSQDPTEADPVISGTAVQVVSGTNKFRAFRADLSPSAISANVFTLKVGTPAFSPNQGPISHGTMVAISTITSNAVIHYSLDGSTPTTNSLLYISPISLNGNTTLIARGFREGFTDSDIKQQFYSLAAVSPVTFNPSAGPVTNGTPVSISCATSNAIIHYTLDGTTPNTNSPVYSSPIIINSPLILKAQAFRSDLGPSTTQSVFYGLLSYDKTIVSTVAGNSVAGLSNSFGQFAQFSSPFGICIDRSNTLFVADYGNNVIRKILPSGEVSTFAGTGMAGSADGPRETAEFSGPSGVCVDDFGQLYVADRNNCYRVRKIDTNGIVTTIASLNHCYLGATLWQVEADPNGNVYASSYGAIWKIAPNGTVDWLAGPGNTAGQGWNLDRIGVGIDPLTNIFAVTQYRVWKILPNGTNSIYAGSTNAYFGSGFSDGPRVTCLFLEPSDAVVDSAFNIFVSDYTRIRRIDPSGWVSTFAGIGSAGYLSGPSDKAQFSGTAGICVDTNGNVYVTDSGNNRIRRISLDSDSDGVPDFEETPGSGFNFGVDDREIDSDGDGQSNADEYIAGTDPSIQSDYFRIDGFTLVGTDLGFTWTAASNRFYKLMSSSNLTTWNAITNIPTVSAGPRTLNIASSVSSNSKAFYRLTVSIP